MSYEHLSAPSDSKPRPISPSPLKRPSQIAATKDAVIEPAAKAAEPISAATHSPIPAAKPLAEKDTPPPLPITVVLDKQNFDISEKVPVEQFIDTDANGQPLKTMTNVDVLLRFYNVTARYNVIRKDIEIIIPEQESCPETAANTALTVLTSLATLNGIYSGNFERFVYAIASKRQFNPVVEWICSKPWDNKDRITDLVNSIETENENFSVYLKPILITKWLLSAVAAATMSKGFSCRGVLVLQGLQGIGKTRWIASLVGDPVLRDEVVKLDHHLDGNNKDSILNAIRHWLVEIGELDSSFKKDVARLKGFITSDRDKIRLPYDRKESDYPRRTVFAATVNASDFLVDPTGSTRWWTLPCTAINYQHDICTQQLWAQVYVLLQAGGKDAEWWLTAAEQELLEDCNSAHQIVNAVTDQLESALDFDAPKDKWLRLSATEVLLQINIERPTNQQARDCGTYLRLKLGEPNRSQGKNRWLVPPNVDKNATEISKITLLPGEIGDDEY